jgi:hypothetical protein
MMDGGQVPNLKNLDPADRVQEITTARTPTPSRRLTDKRASFGSAIKKPLVVRRSLSMTVSKLLIGFSFVLYVFAFLGQSTDPLLADSTIVPVVTDLPSLKLVEKERRMIGERTRAGLAAAKKRGVKLGSLNAGLSRLKHASVRLLVCSAKTLNCICINSV